VNKNELKAKWTKKPMFNDKLIIELIDESFKAGQDDTFKNIEHKLLILNGCPECSIPLTESHFCSRCNERVAVESDYDGLIVWLEELKSTRCKE
jgi:hypothetical protein